MNLKLLSRPVESFAPRTIWCLGRNYTEHARELGNKVEAKPLVFQKGINALAPFEGEVKLDWALGPIHYETELVLLMDRGADIPRLAGIGIGLDLTLRDLQAELKAAGKPWTLAKSFDQAAIISSFVPVRALGDLNEMVFTMHVNGELRQTGATAKMILPIPDMVQYLEAYTRLQRGDLIFTGTPAGVGRLHPGDAVVAELAEHLKAKVTFV